MSKSIIRHEKENFNLMDSTQLAEVLFRSTQVKEKLKRDCNAFGYTLTEKETNQIRIEVDIKIRETIESLTGKVLAHE